MGNHASLQGEATVQTMAWGLVPSWTKMGDKLDFFRMFNARSETVPEKSVFSRLLGAKRCIVLLNGFYEWAQVPLAPPHDVFLACDATAHALGCSQLHFMHALPYMRQSR